MKEQRIMVKFIGSNKRFKHWLKGWKPLAEKMAERNRGKKGAAAGGRVS